MMIRSLAPHLHRQRIQFKTGRSRIWPSRTFNFGSLKTMFRIVRPFSSKAWMGFLYYRWLWKTWLAPLLILWPSKRGRCTTNYMKGENSMVAHLHLLRSTRMFLLSFNPRARLTHVSTSHLPTAPAVTNCFVWSIRLAAGSAEQGKTVLSEMYIRNISSAECLWLCSCDSRCRFYVLLYITSKINIILYNFRKWNSKIIFIFLS